MKVTVGVKAFNEENNIAASLRSAIAAVAPLDGEVVLADCCSDDRTIEIARTIAGVRIYQLANPADRSCGAGAQLAFQFAGGDYFYLLDGDMVLDPAFLAEGIAFLDGNPTYAGVGGRVREANVESVEFELRARNDEINGSAIAGDVDRLDCGGLYRTQAVREIGYFADRNLHAFEELDLGARLRSRGWRLARIAAPAVFHHGHRIGGYRLIWKRIRSGYAGALGEVIRAACGQRHFRLIFGHFRQLHYSIVVMCWWILLAIAMINEHVLAIFLIIVAPMFFLAWRRRSLTLGLYSAATWNMCAWGLITGIVRTRVLPTTPLVAVRQDDVACPDCDTGAEGPCCRRARGMASEG